LIIPPTAHFIADDWALDAADTGYGVSPIGRAEIAPGIRPLWRTELTYVVESADPDKMLAWEAWTERSRRGYRTTRITPALSRRHYDGADEFGGVAVALDAAAAPEDCEIRVTTAAPLQIGKFIWLDSVMHRVVAIDGVDVEIAPPIRASADAGTALRGTGSIAMVYETPNEAIIDRERGGEARTTFAMIEVEEDEIADLPATPIATGFDLVLWAEDVGFIPGTPNVLANDTGDSLEVTRIESVLGDFSLTNGGWSDFIKPVNDIDGMPLGRLRINVDGTIDFDDFDDEIGKDEYNLVATYTVEDAIGQTETEVILIVIEARD